MNMESHRIIFDELEWQSPMHGVRFKAYSAKGKQLRLVEFSAEFVEPHWCEKGHSGVILDGVLEVDFHGRTERFQAGDGLYIPSGPEHGHKARSLTPVVRLFLVEDLA